MSVQKDIWNKNQEVVFLHVLMCSKNWHLNIKSTYLSIFKWNFLQLNYFSKNLGKNKLYPNFVSTLFWCGFWIFDPIFEKCVSQTLFETLWGLSHHQFYKIYKTNSDSHIKIEKHNCFCLLSEQPNWKPYIMISKCIHQLLG